MNRNYIYLNDSRFMPELKENSVDLVITSPPYFNLVDYEADAQIGINETYHKYIESMEKVWRRCMYALRDNGTICINVCCSTELSRKNNNFYFDIKHEIERFFTENDYYIAGTVIWNLNNEKYINRQVERFYDAYPQSTPIVLNNYEYVLIFKKKSDFKRSDGNFENQQMIDCVWNIPWDYDTKPPAFPKELVNRLIEIYSKEGDVILDPFMGTATTSKCAFEANRSFITYEINENSYIKATSYFSNLGVEVG